MKKYNSYKSTKIEFLDTIPEKWEEKRLRFIGYLYGGLTGKVANDFNQSDKEGNKYFIPFTNIAGNLKIDCNKLQQVVIDEEEMQNEVRMGDLFFLMSSEDYEDIGRSSVLINDLHETYLNSLCKGFRITHSEINPEFLNYHLHSKQLRHNLLTQANGFTRINLKIGKVQDLYVAFPSKQDQTAIADYLDRKTAAIDDLIEDKKRLLQLYEEEKQAVIDELVTGKKVWNGKEWTKPQEVKDSGIEWLGEIPKDWEVRKLKYVALTYPSNVDKKSRDDEENVLLCNYMDVYKNDFISSDLKFMQATASYNQIRKFELNEGDVLVTKDSERPDDIAIPSLVKDELDNLICGYHLNLIRPVELIGNFLFRFLQSKYSTSYFYCASNGVTRFAVGAEKFSNFLILKPTQEDQKDIINKIEKETNRINHKINNTNRLIDLLQEYRQALISEVVTGKVKVTD